MGIRNLICIRINKKCYDRTYSSTRLLQADLQSRVVAQYSQWGGHFEVQGLKIFKFLQGTDVARLREGLTNTYEPDEEEFKQITKAVEDEEKRLRDEDERLGRFQSYILENSPWDSMYPSLSRDAGAKILQLIADSDAEHKVPIQLDLEFANKGIHCEWAYVIDFDEETLAVFENAIMKCFEDESNPFLEVGPDDASIPKLAVTFDLSRIEDMTEAGFLEEVRAAVMSESIISDYPSPFHTDDF
ncbi:hypothetical protein M426DRAFT_17079 [Hypoxylon sp. CI-4A]|nr:hypothetical protein M426DRAFT_17079 [Hypoxylon sp. CI-4A]